MTFSILFWNIWYCNQIGDNTKFDNLLNELKEIIDRYQPTLIALSEVIQPSNTALPPIVQYLQEFGYIHTHYTQMAELPDYWLSGVALCSKVELNNKQTHIISQNAYASNHGYPGLKKEILSARLALEKNQEVNIIVAHPPAMRDSFKENRAAIKSLEQLIRFEPYNHNTILAGDMNEWRHAPGTLWRKTSDIMHARTSSILRPTWRYNAHRLTPIRLNLDYIYWSKMSSLKLNDFKVLESNTSDHRPLFASFECLTRHEI